jgi:hypothetical protein
MIIPGQFGFNCPTGFREEAFWNIFPIGSNVKLSPAWHSFYIGPIGSSYNQVNDTGSWEPLVLWNNINLKMNIHVQFGFNHICSFWKEGIWTFSHRVQCYSMSCGGAFIVFSSPGPKVHMSYCHHLASVVCRL